MKMIKPGAYPYSHISQSDAILNIAGAARTCYASTGKNYSTELGLIEKLIKNNHMSPFEQAQVGLRIVCSRSCSHQLVRHRHFSFCQESQRYVKIDEPVCVAPEGFYDWDESTRTLWGTCVSSSFATYDKFVNENGITPQAARSVLPNCTATTLVMTGNLRCWMEFLEKRLFTPGADVEMIEVANQILSCLQGIYPKIMEVWL